MQFLSVTNKKETRLHQKPFGIMDTISRKTSHNSLTINKKPTLRISAEGWTILT